jgi:hypothetical protein
MRFLIPWWISLLLLTPSCKRSQVFERSASPDIEQLPQFLEPRKAPPRLAFQGELDISLRSGRSVDREGENADDLCTGVVRLLVYDNGFRHYPSAPTKCFNNLNLDLAKLLLSDAATPEDGVKDVEGLFQGIYYNAVLSQNYNPTKMNSGTVFGFTDSANNPEYFPAGLPALITQPQLLASYLGKTYSKTVFARTNTGITSPGSWSFRVNSMGDTVTTPSGLRFDNVAKAVRIVDGFDEIPAYLKGLGPGLNKSYSESWQNIDPYAPVYERYRMDITDLVDGAIIGAILQGVLNDVEVELHLKTWRSL